jgi:hypothetical protein
MKKIISLALILAMAAGLLPAVTALELPADDWELLDDREAEVNIERERYRNAGLSGEEEYTLFQGARGRAHAFGIMEATASIAGASSADDFSFDQISSDMVAVTGFHGNGSHITIPSRIDAFDRHGNIIPGHFRVVTVADRAFQNNNSIISVTMDSIVLIGLRAFENCRNLTTVNFGTGLRWIDVGAFEGCRLLTGIVLPNGLESIDQSAFRNCTSLTGINIPDSVYELERRAFEGCTSLSELTLGKGLTTIGFSAFRGTALRRVTIPDNVTMIDSDAFADCTSLTDVVIGNGVTIIGRGLDSSSVFRGCTSLVNVTIGRNVRIIGTGAFADCVSLVNIRIPDSVVAIGRLAFSNSTSLSNVTLGSGIINIGSNAFQNTALLNNSPDGPVIIGNWIVGYKGDIPAEVEVENGIIGIADFTFSNSTALTRVTIPSSVRHLDLPFTGCPNVVIYCYRNSAAHLFAIANKYRFVLLESDFDHKENVIAPGSADGFSINLSFDSITLPAGYAAVVFSTDGGNRWRAARADTFSAARFPALLNRGMTLHISDKPLDKTTKKPPEDSVVTFPIINRRPAAPRLVINYAVAADPTGETPGEWVLTERNGTAAVRDGVEIGRGVTVNRRIVLDGAGYGQFLPDRGVPVEPSVNDKSERSIFFIRTAPQVNENVYTAAGRTRRITALGQLKRPHYITITRSATNTKPASAIVRVRPGTYVTINGETMLYTVRTDINVLGIEARDINFWHSATARRPASAKQKSKPPLL